MTEAEGHKGKSKDASFAPLDAGALFEDTEERKDSYFLLQEDAVSISGYPQPVLCEWAILLGESRQPNDIHIMLQDPRTRGTLADISIAVNDDGTSLGVWNMYHRYVAKSERRKGLGSFVLATVEETVRVLRKRYPSLPRTIRIDSGRPSLTEFAKENGYAPQENEQWELFQRYQKERDEHKEDDAFIERGELPSFFLAEETDENKDPVLVYRPLFEAHLKTFAPETKETILRKGKGKLPVLVNSGPYVVRPTLTKTLFENRAKK